jgi:hypothetical protein
MIKLFVHLLVISVFVKVIVLQPPPLDAGDRDRKTDLHKDAI